MRLLVSGLCVLFVFAGYPASANNDSAYSKSSFKTTPVSCYGRVHVKPYYRKDGTYVHGHTRKCPKKRPYGYKF